MNTMTLQHHFLAQLDATGLVAILRGVRPDEVLAIGTALYETGFRLIEIPLNSPDPMRSIEHLASALPADVLVGAGTVMSTTQVRDVQSAGGRLIVMPHSAPDVIRAAADADLIALPGVATPTEAFAALAHGATGLKLFPAETLPPVAVKAWRAVLPKETRLLPVGGITPRQARRLSGGRRIRLWSGRCPVPARRHPADRPRERSGVHVPLVAGPQADTLTPSRAVMAGPACCPGWWRASARRGVKWPHWRPSAARRKPDRDPGSVESAGC